LSRNVTAPIRQQQTASDEDSSLSIAVGTAVAGGFPREPSELDQARLLGVQLQGELREPVAQAGPEPLGVVPVLEPHHEVVGEAHDHDISVRVSAPPLVGP
jgi:hypothetical protein